MTRYQPRRLGTDLPRPTERRKPRRLRRGAAEPRRLVSTPRNPPVVRLLLMAAALTAAATLGGTAARYLKEWSDSSLVTAGNFYFTSKELDGALHYLTVTNEGKAKFAFTLQNYIVAGYPTESDIAYTCSVKSGGGEIGVDWLNGDSTLAAAEGTITGGGDQNRKLICSVPAEAFGADGAETLTVTVSAKEPYTADLTARVALSVGDGGVETEVTDPGDNKWGSVAVTLYNTSGEERTGTLSWPQEDLKLVPDRTWEIEVGENGALTIPAGRAVSVVFLKRDTRENFDKSDFTFTVSQ